MIGTFQRKGPFHVRIHISKITGGNINQREKKNHNSWALVRVLDLVLVMVNKWS